MKQRTEMAEREDTSLALSLEFKEQEESIKQSNAYKSLDEKNETIKQ